MPETPDLSPEPDPGELSTVRSLSEFSTGAGYQPAPASIGLPSELSTGAIQGGQGDAQAQALIDRMTARINRLARLVNRPTSGADGYGGNEWDALWVDEGAQWASQPTSLEPDAPAPEQHGGGGEHPTHAGQAAAQCGSAAGSPGKSIPPERVPIEKSTQVRPMCPENLEKFRDPLLPMCLENYKKFGDSEHSWGYYEYFGVDYRHCTQCGYLQTAKGQTVEIPGLEQPVENSKIAEVARAGLGQAVDPRVYQCTRRGIKRLERVEQYLLEAYIDQRREVPQQVMWSEGVRSAWELVSKRLETAKTVYTPAVERWWRTFKAWAGWSKPA